MRDGLPLIELTTLINSGVSRVSGGYATAEVLGIDDGYVYIRVEYGIRNYPPNYPMRVIRKWKVSRRALDTVRGEGVTGGNFLPLLEEA